MAWEFTDDVEVYRAHVWDLLAAHPADNTLALTVIENVSAGRRWSEEPMLFGWCGSGPACGAVSMTPPHEMLLAAVPRVDVSNAGALSERQPTDAVADLVTALRARGAVIPGVNGETAIAEGFAAAWRADGRSVTTVTGTLRLYVLGSLESPTPAPTGVARRAVAGDVTAVVRWWTSFQRETGGHSFEVEPTVRGRIEARLVWLWTDETGGIVSLAARNQAASVARIGPVYTPTEHRRLGYGAAVTAACVGDALEQGAEAVVLFTDLANPTSNAIYIRRSAFDPSGITGSFSSTCLEVDGR